ncbi:hypothetical protein SmJEL517_g04494 [Synchytrium microbalum]|uniref:AMP-dependent synthetase/ligase domain-containing protein n=1 Tax=Synchytrium microbalum TaxID=1806994 RepID=A0A507BTN4_9FUNG|nr:uncharacterized protein SmJEL517_g04494 [Synchytrium microbalum]TPX32347.1 hypothetical protein SmJEL517_g04494 [Synchytrium microbalum]
MATATQPAIPKGLTMDQCHAIIAKNPVFALEEKDIRGVKIRVFKNPIQTLRAVWQASRAHGEHISVVYENERYTFNEQNKRVIAIANTLYNIKGARKGDRVAIAARNLPEWIVCFWAAASIGCIVVPINAWLTGAELEYCIRDCGAKVLVCDAERLERLQPHLAALKELRHVIVCRVPAGARLQCPANLISYEDALSASNGANDVPDVKIDAEDEATIFYTSGTTGRPKGALGTNRNFTTSLFAGAAGQVRSFLRRGELPPAPNPSAPKMATLLAIPLFHATGCISSLQSSTFAGNKIVMMYKFEALEALKLIQKEKITGVGGVPFIAWQILEHPQRKDFDLSSIVGFGYGGAPAAVTLAQKISKDFPLATAANGYGLTESSALTIGNSGEDYIRKPSSIGYPTLVNDVRIVGEDGKDCPVNEIGELFIKGPNIVKGYWNMPEATAKTFENGWLKTGDLATIDEEGFVYIKDRAKDMLIRGGENVYCVEVENALYTHEAIMDAACVGLPHEVLGEEVAASVQIKPQYWGKVTEADIQAHMKTKVAGFKVPVFIDLRQESIIRNANGKIDKKLLRPEVIAAAAKGRKVFVKL